MSDVRKIEKTDDGSLSMSVKHGGSAAQSDLDLEQHSDDGDGYYAADIWGLHAPRSWPRRCSSVVVTDKHCVKSLEHDVRNEGRMSYSGTNYDEIMRVSCLRHNNSSNVRLRQQYRENMVRKVV